MANVNSTLVTNYLATTPAMNPVHQLHGVMRVASGTIALAAGDQSAGDTAMLAQIPTNASIVSLKIYNDDLDTGTDSTLNVGLWSSDGNVTAVDADAYASLVTDLRGAVTVGTELAFEARNVNLMGQQLWEDAGVSSDPGGYYLVGLQFAAAGDAGGDVSWLITYVVN